LYKLLYNHQISPKILDIIDESDEYVNLISPYLKFWGHLEKQIESCLKRNVDINIFFRTDKIEEYKQTEILKKLSIEGVNFFHTENLHTKLYFSEKQGILGSMNLHDFSQQNSEELCIYTEDSEMISNFGNYLKREVKNRSERLKINKLFEFSKEKIETTKKVFKKTKDVVKKIKKVVSDNGFCIRCKDDIELNVKVPYCKKCYKSWNRYKDKKYEEKHCHDCGKSNKSTMLRPICYICFKS
jgi:phosphatidylserine/phosphatidylglycerophosphate/cardiolipin synthase-like enzyme